MSDEAMDIVRLIAYAFFVLVAGLVLWRIAVIFAKKKRKPQGGKYFKSKYKDHWDK